MRLQSQDDILDEDVRKRIIEEIEASENQRRKSRAYKWNEIFKDRTKDFVRELLIRQLSKETVNEMEYALANISIVKKIINKLAKVYANGVERSYDTDAETEAINALEKKLRANANLKTANNIVKLHRNAVVYIKPVSSIDNNGEKMWRPSLIPMSPHLYDVVEEKEDRTMPMVYVLTNFERQSVDSDSALVPERAAHHRIQSSSFPGNRIDEIIADNKEDEGADDQEKKEYIWWTDKWHFTTKGTEIINPETMEPLVAENDAEFLTMITNPIEEKPFVDIHIDQEGSYWADGGEDLIDGGLLINSLISNANHIGITQGYGQLVVTGSDNSTFMTGPNKVILLPTPKDDTETRQAKAEFITADPPLAELGAQIEQYIALLLTTNNLSSSGIVASLRGGISAPSGIALAIDKAESMEDISSQQDIFSDAEKDLWRIVAKWVQNFAENNELDETFEDCKIPVEDSPMVEFRDAQIIMSETEKLENIKLRKELGLNLKVELIMKDRGIDEEQAKKLLVDITAERSAQMDEVLGQRNDENDDSQEDDVDEDRAI